MNPGQVYRYVNDDLLVIDINDSLVSVFRISEDCDSCSTWESLDVEYVRVNEFDSLDLVDVSDQKDITKHIQRFAEIMRDERTIPGVWECGCGYKTNSPRIEDMSTSECTRCRKKVAA